MTVLDKECRAVLKDTIRTLKEQKRILEDMADKGLDMYNSLPTGVKESDRGLDLDASNWNLKGASVDIESAIFNIKQVLE